MTDTGFSSWALGERHRHHARHADLAHGFMEPSAVPYPAPLYAPGIAPEQVERMHVLLAAGLSKAAVSREVGCHRATVQRYARTARVLR